jgi:hypothetical protein
VVGSLGGWILILILIFGASVVRWVGLVRHVASARFKQRFVGHYQ